MGEWGVVGWWHKVLLRASWNCAFYLLLRLKSDTVREASHHSSFMVQMFIKGISREGDCFKNFWMVVYNFEASLIISWTAGSQFCWFLSSVFYAWPIFDSCFVKFVCRISVGITFWDLIRGLDFDYHQGRMSILVLWTLCEKLMRGRQKVLLC